MAFPIGNRLSSTPFTCPKSLNKHTTNMQSSKYYVVWKGYAPGVYDSWEEAELQVSGYPEASFRAYKTQEAAIEAFREGYDRDGLVQQINRQTAELSREGNKIDYKEGRGTLANAPAPTNNGPRRLRSIGVRDVKGTSETTVAPKPSDTKSRVAPPYILDSLAVDAACSGNPGRMEYRGVLVRTGEQIFHVGPLEQGTNNIGEFLAIVHGLALQEKQGTSLPIYSDSVNAQLWVRQGICKTKLEENEANAPIFDLIRRAEQWLRTHTFRLPIYKWETKLWGEIPADFGRK